MVSAWGFPFRTLVALISARPVLKLEPAAVFAGPPMSTGRV
jgi:hypothetical protein